MKRLSVVLLVLVIAGCQSGVGSPPLDEEPQEEVLEQPLPDQPNPEPPPPVEPEPEPQPEPEPDPEPTPRIHAGTYIGRVQCRRETSVLGSATSRTDVSHFETATFDSDGHLLIGTEPLKVGDITTRGPQPNPWFFLYQSITNSSNALILDGDTHWQFDCGNSCFFAFDLICDEIGLCNVGTDCADCGPLILRGLFQTIYQGQDDGTILMIQNLLVLEEDASLLQMSSNCDGILSR